MLRFSRSKKVKGSDQLPVVEVGTTCHYKVHPKPNQSLSLGWEETLLKSCYTILDVCSVSISYPNQVFTDSYVKTKIYRLCAPLLTTQTQQTVLRGSRRPLTGRKDLRVLRHYSKNEHQIFTLTALLDGVFISSPSACFFLRPEVSNAEPNMGIVPLIVRKLLRPKNLVRICGLISVEKQYFGLTSPLSCASLYTWRLTEMCPFVFISFTAQIIHGWLSS